MSLFILGCSESSFEGERNISKNPESKEQNEKKTPAKTNDSKKSEESSPGTKEKVAVKPSPSEIEEEETEVECDQDSGIVTQSTLLTKSISPTDSPTILRYELTSVDCEKQKVVSLSGKTIKFDVDASGAGIREINYTITDASSKDVLVEGTFDKVEGTDLFGNFGEFYHLTTQSISQDTPVSSAIIEITIPNTSPIMPRLGGQILDTFLKAGDATAV